MSTAGATVMDHQHGAVNNRCSHPDCAAAFARWSKRYKLDKSRGVPRTLDADAARHHLAKLEGAGWSRRAVAGASGVSDTALWRIAAGQPTVRVAILRKILAIDPASLPQEPGRSSAFVFVPRVGTVRRVQALLALGWTHAHISAASGCRTPILLGQQGRWVSRPTHDKVAAAYRELSGRLGPSAVTRRRALALGYLSPAAWDDLDMDVEPDLGDDALEEDSEVGSDVDDAVVQRLLDGQVVPTTVAERREVVARWASTGRSLADLERMTGWNAHRYIDEQEQAS